LGAASYAAGTPGGLFAPLLVLGAQMGFIFGGLVHPDTADPTSHAVAFAVVGMAAIFTAVVRAPLTGMILVTEMTESSQLLLPMLAACFSAMAVATMLREPPIYDALRRNQFALKSTEPIVAVGFPVAAVEIIADLDLADVLRIFEAELGRDSELHRETIFAGKHLAIKPECELRLGVQRGRHVDVCESQRKVTYLALKSAPIRAKKSENRTPVHLPIALHPSMQICRVIWVNLGSACSSLSVQGFWFSVSPVMSRWKSPGSITGALSSG
jgi:hypothetical protein